MTLVDLSDLHDSVSASGSAAPLPCCEDDAAIWFGELAQDIELAKTLCGTCPVRAPCLAGALRRQEPWGVWGGELFVNGQIVAHKRPPGRPRKNPIAA